MKEEAEIPAHAMADHVVAADGRRNLAIYAAEVVADLASHRKLNEMLAGEEVMLTETSEGEAYALTLKGRIAASRALIEGETLTLQGLLAEMSQRQSTKARPSKGKRAG
jgi:hypothetical protein